jgi:hypothetical protein
MSRPDVAFDDSHLKMTMASQAVNFFAYFPLVLLAIWAAVGREDENRSTQLTLVASRQQPTSLGNSEFLTIE